MGEEASGLAGTTERRRFGGVVADFVAGVSFVHDPQAEPFAGEVEELRDGLPAFAFTLHPNTESAVVQLAFTKLL